MNLKNQSNQDITTGSIDLILKEINKEMKLNLDRDKYEFLKLISKTKYSGLTLNNLISTMNILKNKDNKWFEELVNEGLAEIISFKNPNGRYDGKWEGWFITKKGRSIIREINNRMKK